MSPWLNLDRERWAPSAIRIGDSICIVMAVTGGVMCLVTLVAFFIVGKFTSAARYGWPVWVGLSLIVFAFPARYIAVRIAQRQIAFPTKQREEAPTITAPMSQRNDTYVRQPGLRDIQELSETHSVEP